MAQAPLPAERLPLQGTWSTWHSQIGVNPNNRYLGTSILWYVCTLVQEQPLFTANIQNAFRTLRRGCLPYGYFHLKHTLIFHFNFFFLSLSLSL